jgi:hypothetical protein
MACSYCGYTGRDRDAHDEIHKMLDEVMVEEGPRFSQLWAQLAIMLNWPFVCYGSDGKGSVRNHAAAWRKWAAIT